MTDAEYIGALKSQPVLRAYLRAVWELPVAALPPWHARQAYVTHVQRRCDQDAVGALDEQAVLSEWTDRSERA